MPRETKTTTKERSVVSAVLSLNCCFELSVCHTHHQELEQHLISGREPCLGAMRLVSTTIALSPIVLMSSLARSALRCCYGLLPDRPMTDSKPASSINALWPFITARLDLALKADRRHLPQSPSAAAATVSRAADSASAQQRSILLRISPFGQKIRCAPQETNPILPGLSLTHHRTTKKCTKSQCTAQQYPEPSRETIIRYSSRRPDH